MLFSIVRRDRPAMVEVRTRLQPAHEAYQENFASQLVYVAAMIGDDVEPTPEMDLGEIFGHIVVIDVPDRAAAEAFHRGDPYTKAGLFETVSIEHLRQRVPKPG